MAESSQYFENLSGLQNLHVLQAQSAEELLALIRQIRLPAKPISIYAIAGRHYAWVMTTARIKQTKTESKTKG